MPGLLGNKLPSFKIGACRGCADYDAGKVSKGGHKRREKHVIDKELLDELDAYFRPLLINQRDLATIARMVLDGDVELP